MVLLFCENQNAEALSAKNTTVPHSQDELLSSISSMANAWNSILSQTIAFFSLHSMYCGNYRRL
jgi:hypothetical protein